MARSTKNSKEWWEELNRLAVLLKRWGLKRTSRELREQVLGSIEKLGFIVQKD